MKLTCTLVLIVTFMTSSAFAATTTCGASYAVGLGHVLKGESRSLYHNGDQSDNDQVFGLNERVSDEFTSVVVTTNDGPLNVSALNSRDEVIEMTTREVAPGLIVSVSTSDLVLAPEGVPGAFASGVRLFVMCSNE